MTVVHKTKKTSIKVKQTKHPNDAKYAGKPCMEVNQAFFTFISELSEKQFAALRKGELVVEPEATDEFFDEIQKDDVVGLAVYRGIYDDGTDHSAAYKFKILEIDHAKGRALARDITFENPKRPDTIGAGKEVELFYEDFSFGMNLGFGEILMRDEKPYGLPEEIEQSVVLHFMEEQKPWDKEVLENDKLTDDEIEEMWKKTVAADFFFKVEKPDDGEEDVAVCTIVPKSYYTEHKAYFDQCGDMSHIFGEELSEKMSEVSDCVFEYDGTVEEATKALTDLGFEPNQEI